MDTVSGGSYYGTDIVGEKIGVIECGNDSLFRLVGDYYWSKNNDGFPAYMEVMAEVYGNWWLFSNLEEETEDDRRKADYRRKYCDAYRHKLLADSLENIPLKREEPCKDYLNRRHYVELVETGDTALFALRFDGLMAHPNSQAYCWIMANVYGRPQVVDRAYGYYEYAPANYWVYRTLTDCDTLEAEQRDVALWVLRKGAALGDTAAVAELARLETKRR